MGEVAAHIGWVIEPFGRVGGTEYDAVVLTACHATRFGQDCLGLGPVRDHFPLVRDDPLARKSAQHVSVMHGPFGISVSIQFACVQYFSVAIGLIRFHSRGGRHEWFVSKGPCRNAATHKLSAWYADNTSAAVQQITKLILLEIGPMAATRRRVGGRGSSVRAPSSGRTRQRDRS